MTSLIVGQRPPVALPEMNREIFGRGQMLTLGATTYAIDEELGRGGYGVVFKAHDHANPSKVYALKFIEDQGRSSQPFQEARLLRDLRHGNIIRLVDYGRWEGRVVLVFEYISGGDLERAAREGGTFTAAQTRDLLTQLARGLSAAHAEPNRVVHCDIKPSNILVDHEGDRPRYVLTDFGVSRIASTLQTAPRIAGTRLYMAPEQLRGRYSPRSDLWAIGVVAYEMLTGVHPFRPEKRAETAEETWKEIRRKIEFAAVPTPSVRAYHGDPELDTILLRLLEKLPGDRYDSADELLAVLQPAKPTKKQDNQDTLSTPVPAPGDAPLSAWELELEKRARKSWNTARIFFWWAAIFNLILPLFLYYRAAQNLGAAEEADKEKAGRLRRSAFGYLIGATVFEIVVSNILAFGLGLVVGILKLRLTGGASQAEAAGTAVFLWVILSLSGTATFLWLIVQASKHYTEYRKTERTLRLYQALAAASGGKEEALQALRRIVDTTPEELLTHVRYVEQLRNRNLPEEAAVECRLILERDPYNADALYHLAACYQELKLTEHCRQVCDNVLSYSPYSFEFAEVKDRLTERTETTALRSDDPLDSVRTERPS